MLWTLLVGLIVGAVAKFFMPGKDGGGIIVTMILGVLGAMLAHWIGASAGWYAENEPAGFISSVLGAMLLLFVYRLAIGRRRIV